MLLRAARQARHNAIRQRISGESFSLPWLYPTFCRESRIQFSNGTASQSRTSFRKRRNSTDSSIALPRRNLATAVSFHPLDDIPFESLDAASLSTHGGMDHISSLRPLGPSDTLMLGGSLSEAPSRFRQQAGIGGPLEEILSILDACLQVGRIERARVIMKRIAKLGVLNGSTMLELHNRFIKASLDQIIHNPSESATQAIHKWFELEIRSKGLEHSDETLAYMLKASLQSSPGNRQQRLVRRYMDMAEDGCATLLHDILTPLEMHNVLQICPQITPDYFQVPAEEVEESEAIELEAQETTTLFQDAVPEVREQLQRGLGLKTLKQTLSLLRTNSQGLNMASLSHEEKALLQKKIEEDAVSAAIDRWREESANLKKMGVDGSLQTKSLGARMWRWQCALQEHLKVELVKVEEAEMAERKNLTDQDRCQYGPYLRLVPLDKLAAVTIVSAMGSLTKYGLDKGCVLATTIMEIASNVEDETLFERAKKSDKKQLRIRVQNKARFSRRALLKQSLLNTNFEDASDAQRESLRTEIESLCQQTWPMNLKAKIGAFLMSALIESAKIPVTMEHPETKEVVTQLQPAFSHSIRMKAGKKVGVIVANRVIVDLLKREPVHSLLAKQLPMLVSPQPWTSFDKGGFLAHPTKAMRIKAGDKDQRYYAEAAVLKGDMTQVFKGLDVLGKTSWRINHRVFDVMLEAWNSGEAVANLAPENPQVEIPPEPENSSTDPLARRRWIAAVKVAENTKSGYHSQRCFQNFQLEIARALRNETFYFPHNVDFRGRAYPIPPYLNHMGADHCRGLLMFGKGKALGVSGLKWLKVHLANLYGFDKASLKEREDFAMDNLANIYDSATNPLGGEKWWLKAEDPWQCLAACLELKNALDSQNPEEFVSSLPIHQDGTCNGLQHYAALGGDEAGAKQVNLEPGDRPGDVYSAVADLVKASIADDLKAGNPFAKVLNGKVTRKTVKQTVMTNVYGVTFIGAKAQVRKQLVAAFPDLPNTTSMNPGILSSYVAIKIFSSLSSMFSGAHDIQYWFGECANRICSSFSVEQMDRLEKKVLEMEKQSSDTSSAQMAKLISEGHALFKSSVIWTSPLRMPVVQPYRTTKPRLVATSLQRLNLAEPHVSDPVSKRKQLQGFPPNFIHSLDATHMILSALQCDEMGLSFAAVHDSFWTHASDVDLMNGVLRDAFVRIHSDDVIGRLAAEFAARYKGSMYLAKVPAGTPLHKKITNSRLKHKTKGKTYLGSKFKELLQERKRLRLINSSDPREVEEGKAMITPGSLYEEYNGAAADVIPVEEYKDLALGAINDQDTQSLEDITEDGMDAMSGTVTEDAEDVCVDAVRTTDTSELDDIARKEDDEFGAKITLKPKIRSAPDKSTWVWLPLDFPDVPKKGKFDVTRLRSSDYFFS